MRDNIQRSLNAAIGNQGIYIEQAQYLANKYFHLKNSKFFTRSSDETLELISTLCKKNITNAERYSMLSDYIKKPKNHHRDFYKMIQSLAKQEPLKEMKTIKGSAFFNRWEGTQENKQKLKVLIQIAKQILLPTNEQNNANNTNPPRPI